jgi:YhgE/Pip N-terminal domain/YhgE/Pip C-terminal domain
MNVFHLIAAELKEIFSSPRHIEFMLAVMCIPLLYAGIFLYGFWNAYGNSGRLPVAVVNQDQGAKISGKQINAGNDLVKQLKKNHDLKWTFVNSQQAESGFKNNHYFMTVSIPANFSKNATTLVDQQLKPVNIHYQVNKDYNFVSSKMVTSGLQQMKASVSSAITKTYAQTMYRQLDQLTQGMQKAADGAGTLSSGSKKELAGLNQLKSGYKVLADGTGKVQSGANQLADGASSLNNGLKQVATGTTKLYTQTSANSSNIAKLADGANTLADKLDQLNKGAAQLSNGSGQLTGGSQSLESGMSQYLAGLKQFQQGMQKEKSGLDQLNTQLSASKPQISSIGDQMNQLANGVNKINSGTNQLANGVDQLANQNTGVPKLLSGITALQQKVNNLADQLKAAQTQDPGKLISGLSELTNGIENMKTQVNDPETIKALSDAQKKVTDNLMNIINNEATNNQNINQVINSDASLTQAQKNKLLTQIGSIQKTEQQTTGSLIQGISQNLTNISNSLSTQTSSLNTGLDKFLAALNGINGQPGLNDGITKLVNGQKDMAAGIVANGNNVTLQSGVNQMATGITDLRNNVVGIPGQNGMNNGMPSLYLGSQQLKLGTNTLANQVNSSNSSQQITNQLSQLSSAVNQLDNGMEQLNSGSQSLNSNFVKLSDGTKRLNSGMKTLQANLSKIPGATKALGNGASQLASGNQQLKQTWPQLVSGIHTLQTGTNQLTSGSNQLTTNMNSLSSGISGLASGQQKLASGTNQVASGAQQLSNGNSKLAGNLSSAHAQLAKTPTNNAHAQKFSSPVTAIDGTHQAVDTFGSGFTPYFMCIGLFLGALLLTIVYDLYRPAGLATAGWNIALSKFFITILMSVAQAFLVDLAMIKGLGLHISDPWAFFGFTILLSMSFMAIITWLAGSFNNEGRFAAIVLLLFQLVTSGGAYSIQLIPHWLQALSPLLPFTYGVNGFRNLIDGHQQQMLAQNSTALVVFILIGVGLMVITYTIKFNREQAHRKASRNYGETLSE